MKKVISFLLAAIVLFMSLPFVAAAEPYDYLIGAWKTSAEDVYLVLNSDNTYVLEWTGFPKDEGSWYAQAESNDVCRIEFDGNGVFEMMKEMYQINDANYHFETLKNDDSNFYLVQVYGNYTAYTSPCKLGFTRVGGILNMTPPAEPDTTQEIGEGSELKEHEVNVELTRENKPNYPVKIKWGWEYFLRSAMEYNHELAKASLVISQSIYSRSTFESVLTEKFGFEDVEYSPNSSHFVPGYAFAHKKIEVGENNTKHIILLAVSGSDQPLDWVNDIAAFTEGFRPDTENVSEKLKAYIKKIGCSKSDTILYMTGHSYGGAVAQSLAPYAENYVTTDNRCFIYTFAAPNTFIDLLKSRQYANVHNIINDIDIVPFLQTGLMKYGRKWHYDASDVKYQSSFNTLHSENGWRPDSIKKAHDCVTYYAMMLCELPKEAEVNAPPNSFICVHCPVDVAVKDLQGNVLVSTKAAEVVYESDCPVQVFNDGENKDIFIPAGVQYEVEITGTGEGVMQVKCQSTDLANNQMLTDKEYRDISVHPGEIFKLSVDGVNPDNLKLENRTTGEIYSTVQQESQFPWIYVILGGVAVIIVVEVILLVWALKRKKK